MPAQQNWAGISCYHPKTVEEVNSMFLDSLHNEIILNSNYGYQACNVTYKGVFAYDGTSFRDLDFGLNKFDPNPSANGYKTMGCITYGDKTLFGGAFYTVGSNTLYAKSIALWNRTKWDTFPKFVFPNDLSARGGGINGFLKYQNKLWLYGSFDTIGGVAAKNISSFDGNTFASHNIPILDAYNYNISKMILYKNKLIAGGPFYNTTFTISRVAIYDGSSWASLGNGIIGSLSFVYDMAIYNDTLYIAGSWPQGAGNVSSHIMKWDGTQLSDAGFGNYYGTDAISSLVVYNNRLFALGNFKHAANQRAFGIAYYENGTWTVPKDSIANYGVRYGVVHNNALYIGGAFKNINNDTSIKNFAKLVCPDFDAASGCISAIKKGKLNNFTIKFFPNPVTDKLRLEFDNSITIDKLSISNTLGQQVLFINKPSTEQEIDVSFLPQGVYIVYLSNGINTFSTKFVKASN
jgi:hypothetical protein